jgi:hypothetical protein
MLAILRNPSICLFGHLRGANEIIIYVAVEECTMFDAKR